MISWQVDVQMGSVRGVPAAIHPFIGISTGDSGVAEVVVEATRTNPSMAEFANGGVVRGLAMVEAFVRPMQSKIGRVTVGRSEREREERISSACLYETAITRSVTEIRSL